MTPGPVHALGDAFVHALARARHGASRTRSRRAAGGLRSGIAAFIAAAAWCSAAASRSVRRASAGRSAVCRRRSGPAAFPSRGRQASAGRCGGSSGNTGSLLNGISGRTSPGFAPALRCWSRMKLYFALVSNRRRDAVAQDLRPDEDHEIGLVALAVARLEELADDRDAAEVGHALLAARVRCRGSGRRARRCRRPR